MGGGHGKQPGEQVHFTRGKLEVYEYFVIEYS